MPSSIDYRSLFDATPSPYMLLDRELRFVDANRAYLEVTATRLDQLVGRHLLDAFPNDPGDPDNPSAQRLRASLDKVLRTRRRDVLAFLSYRVPRQAGGEPEERFWSATHSPILDEHGEVAFILQHTVDVTELRRLQQVALSVGVDVSAGHGTVEAEVIERAQQVQESYFALDVEIQRLRRLFAQTPGFVCFLRGPELVFEMSNEAYHQLVGQRDLIGKPVREALPDLAGQGFFELLDRVFATGEPFVGRGVPVSVAHSDGGELRDTILDFVYQPIRQADGTVLGILVQGHDVTEQKRTEMRQRFLAQASEHLASASASLDEALRRLAYAAVASFADWCFVDLVGPEPMRRLVAAQADASDRAPADEAYAFAPPSKVPRDHPTLGRVDARPTLYRDFTDEMAVRAARSPEHLAWIRRLAFRSILVLPLHSRGQRLGVISFCLTRSKRRFDEADLAAAEELARMASSAIDNAILSRERSELLSREQAARERAESANQAKDEFLAMLGHELRNPLSPILTAVQLMKLRGDQSSVREQMIIERQAQHLIRLVDDLLDVSRITSGKVELQRAATEIAAVVARAVEIASPLFEQKQHRLRLDVARQGLRVDGDEVRLSQVVANLLTNAARYTNPGGDIALGAHREGDQIVICVRDNGIGITAEMLPRIFDLFVQASRRSDRSDGGLGLGLTLVRTLVAMHGGTVDAASRGAGAGAEFTVRLPALPDSFVDPPALPAPPLEAPPAASQRILVVDDNVDAAQLLAEILETHGHQTALAHDGPSALTRARNFQPDIAILDIGLPVMDGYELAAQLRLALGAHTPRMIALTGYGQEHDRTRSRDAGFEAHLVKPVDADALFRTLGPPTP